MNINKIGFCRFLIKRIKIRSNSWNLKPSHLYPFQNYPKKLRIGGIHTRSLIFLGFCSDLGFYSGFRSLRVNNTTITIHGWLVSASNGTSATNISKTQQWILSSSLSFCLFHMALFHPKQPSQPPLTLQASTNIHLPRRQQHILPRKTQHLSHQTTHNPNLTPTSTNSPT
jgi:hypothetical protein